VHLEHVIPHQPLDMAMHPLTRYPKVLRRQCDDIRGMLLDMLQDKLPYLGTAFLCANHSQSSISTTLLSNKYVYCQHVMCEL
jgi:hypothetical protein